MPLLDALSLHPLLAEQPAPSGGGSFNMLIIMALFMAGMYFLLIAPQRKKQKQHEKMVAALQSGDAVLTNGGIYGVITKVKDDRFILKISDETKVEMGRGFIQSKVDDKGD